MNETYLASRLFIMHQKTEDYTQRRQSVTGEVTLWKFSNEGKCPLEKKRKKGKQI